MALKNEGKQLFSFMELGISEFLPFALMNSNKDHFAINLLL